MKNKIMFLICSLALAATVLGFTNYVQGPNPDALMQERVNEKLIFDQDQAVYNDKANTQIRSDHLIEKNKETQDTEKKKVEEVQDQTKGQVLVKF